MKKKDKIIQDWIKKKRIKYYGKEFMKCCKDFGKRVNIKQKKLNKE